MNNRLSLFRERLAEREISAAIISDEKNIGYLCGYRFEDGCLLITRENAYVITDFRYKEEAEATVSSAFSVVTPENKPTFIAEALKHEDAKSVGYESRVVTVAEFHRFESAITLPLVPMGDILPQMRAEKREEEIASIKTAQEIAEGAFAHLLSVMDPSMTESDLSLELAYFMRKHGAEGNSFETIAASGSASALPHAKCRKTKISEGFLTLDFGCVYNGYCSDMTRTVCIGRASEEMKRVYNTVLEAQLAAIDFIKAGASCAAVDAVARSIIQAAGYGDAFGHSLGHGVGLNVHELPNLSPRALETRLKAGNIVTVEPGIYLEGRFGCRIEDMGLVTENGFENFTKTPKELVELFV